MLGPVNGFIAAFNTARTELQKLQTTEALNMKLKVEWRKQTRLAKKLKAVLTKHIGQLVRSASVADYGITGGLRSWLIWSSGFQVATG